MTPSERKAASEKLLTEMGVGINPNLPLTEAASEVRLRCLDDICRRAIAALLSTQIGIELSEQRNDNISMFKELMEHFGVADSINAKEARLVNGSFSKQDLIDTIWEYECFWSLAWALGLVDDISDASGICDCLKAIRMVSQCESFEDFRSKCTLRSADEILDMLDLYYRSHWAIVQNRHIDSSCPVGSLDGDVVFERRRGLEWLISDTDDWHDISLDT